jgi:hypothetical protein
MFQLNRSKFGIFYYLHCTKLCCYNFTTRTAIITNFRGCFGQVLIFLGDCLLHVKIMIDAMVRIDSSFDENRKRYDMLFIR